MILGGNTPSFINEFFIFVLNPDLTLALRINHKGISTGVGHHDTILDGQIILGKSLDIPLSDCGFIDEEGS